MNIVEQNDNQYTKERTEVEAYLTRIIQRFFDIENNNTKESIEAIIVESLTRLKRDFYHLKTLIFHFNGKTGHIKVDIRDFNGEEAFEKKTAFNKDFGTDADTICDGNDSRLNDSREPLDHVHTVADIDLLSLLGGTKVVEDAHNHLNNKALDVIQYTGILTKIDLIILEKVLENIQGWEETIRRDALAMQSAKDVTFQPLTNFLDEIKADLATATALLANIDDWLNEAKSYTDSKAAKLEQYLNNLLLESEVAKYNAANDSVFLLTQDTIDMKNMSIFDKIHYSSYSDGFSTHVDYDVSANIPVSIPTGYKVAYIKAYLEYEELEYYVGVDSNGNIANLSRYVQRCSVLPKYYPNVKQDEPFILAYEYTENGSLIINLKFFVKIPSVCKELCLLDNIVAFRTDGMAIQSEIEQHLGYIVSYLNVSRLSATNKTKLFTALDAVPSREYQYVIDGQYKYVFDNDGNISGEGWFDNLGNKMESEDIDWEIGMYEERPGSYLVLNQNNKVESIYANITSVERNALIAVGPSGINGYMRNPKIQYQVYCRKE